MGDAFPRYRNRDTEQFANGAYVRRLQGVPRESAYIRLDFLDAATRLIDLRMPSSNHFERLQGDRWGQYSIRINRKWRICFEWSEEESAAFNIEIVDYHR